MNMSLGEILNLRSQWEELVISSNYQMEMAL
jgi:hypothetical protein